MLEATFELADAVARGAAEKNFLFGKGAATDRALARNGDGAGGSGALLEIDGEDGGDDLSCFFDINVISHTDVLAGDLLKVMQGGARNGGTAEKNGIEFGDGGDDPAATNLKSDSVEAGFGLFGGVFVSDGPARGFFGGEENALLIEAVNFDNGSISGEGEFGAVAVEGVNGLQDVVWSRGEAEPAVPRKTPLKDLLVEGVLSCQGGGLGLGEAVKNNGKWALSDLAGVEKLERASGGIAGVGKEGFPLFLAGVVQRGKGRLGQVNLTAKFNSFWQAANKQGEVADGF
jgi:hypothetical protein